MSSFMQREMELQIADEGLAGNEPASPDHNPKKHAEACHASSTPLSQASTAPTTPNMQFRLPSFSLDGFNDEHFPLLTRQLSIPEDEGATFEAPDMFQDISELYMQKYGKYSKEDSAYRDDDGAPGGANTRPRSSKESLQSLLAEVKDLYEQKYGTTFDQSQASEEEDAESDGPVWRVINGTGAPMDCRVARLEQELAEAKKLYELKYGVEIDAEDANVEYDADGTPWVETRGTGSPRDMRLERLEHMLGNVKGMFAKKYGRDVDTEYDADGTPWTVTEGTGVPRDCRMERLEQKLTEVKKLYELKYGVENDAEDPNVEYDADGTPWVETRGTGSPRDMRLERLEHMLGNVKGLFAQKYGRDVDTEYDADGTPWTVTEGTKVPRDCRVERLEQKLTEVKKLYELKHGVEIDEEDANVEYDADGTPWVETRGTGSPRDMRLERLEHMLGNVKGLFAQKYGRDVDTEYDADGTPWTVTEGTGVPRDCRVERLEQKLAEVKRLFVARYGTSFLTGDNDDWDEAIDFMYDEDGTLWIKSTTTGGPLRIASPLDETLEGMLQEVKTLCDKRFGHKPVEDIQSSWSDEDGAPWIQVGSSSSGASTEKAQPFTGTCGLQ